MTTNRTEQPRAPKRRRGAGRPFTKDDPRINKGGVPSEIRAFHNWMRESFAAILQEESEDGLTNGQHIIRTLIQKAKCGDIKAIEYVLDRMGGKPLQSVELSGSLMHHIITESERTMATASLTKIRAMTATEPVPSFVPILSKKPSQSVVRGWG
jgi:hypothetical protein